MLFSISAGIDLSAYAENNVCGDYEYVLSNGDEARIVKYNGSESEVERNTICFGRLYSNSYRSRVI